MNSQKEGLGMGEIEEALQELEDRLDADEENELFCVACNKEMRNEKAFASHRQQKYINFLYKTSLFLKLKSK